MKNIKLHRTIMIVMLGFYGNGYAHETIDEMTKQKLNQFATVAYSTQETLYTTYLLSQSCVERAIPGDFVECGVAGGAQIAAMAYACQCYNSTDKLIHLFDSFEGIPLAGPHDDQQPGVGAIAHSVDVADMNDLLVSSNIRYPELGRAAICPVENVKEHMQRWGIDMFRLIFHKGWFQHVLPKDADMIGSICLLRLDGDLYESTKVCLEYLYPKVVKGGYVIIDDYALAGCKKAVDDYLSQHNLHPTIIEISGGLGPVYWQVQ